MSFIGHEVKKREQTTFSVPEGRFDQYILGGKMWQLLWPQVFEFRTDLYCFCFASSMLHSMDLRTSSDMRTIPMPGLLALPSDQ